MLRNEHILTPRFFRDHRNFHVLLIRFERKISHKIKNWYLSNFQTCVKCNEKIDPREGFWHYKNKYPLIGGYYHTACGTINNPVTTKMPF